MLTVEWNCYILGTIWWTSRAGSIWKSRFESQINFAWG